MTSEEIKQISELNDRLHIAEMHIKMLEQRLVEQTLNAELSKLHATIERGMKNALAHALTIDKRRIDELFKEVE